MKEILLSGLHENPLFFSFKRYCKHDLIVNAPQEFSTSFTIFQHKRETYEAHTHEYEYSYGYGYNIVTWKFLKN